MIDLNNVTEEDMGDISAIVLKNSERSDFEKYFLFTNDYLEKAKIFVLCYRLLLNIVNITTLKDKTKKELENEVSLLFEAYTSIQYYIEMLRSSSFDKHIVMKKIINILNDKNINNLIDVFSLLTERSIRIRTSRMKGFSLEGKSGDEYKKIFGDTDRYTEV